MPIKFINRVKEQSLATDLELEAKTGQGYVINDIEIRSAVAETKARIIISDTIMLGLPCVFDLANLSPFKGRDGFDIGLFEYIRSKFPDVPLMLISEGEKLVITTGGVAADGKVDFKELSEADIPKSTENGGSISAERLFISYCDQLFTIALSSTEEKELTESDNPAGLSDFPFEVEAPAGYRHELLGFAVAVSVAHADITLDGIRIWLNDISILSVDETYLVPYNIGYFGASGQNKPFLFDERIIINAGDRLKTEIKLTNANVAAQTKSVYFSYIFKLIKL